MTLSAATQKKLNIALASKVGGEEVVTELATMTSATSTAQSTADANTALIGVVAALDSLVSANASDLGSTIALLNELKNRFNIVLSRFVADATLPYLQTFDAVGYDPESDLTLSGFLSTPTVVSAAVDADMPSSTKSLECNIASGIGFFLPTFFPLNPVSGVRATTWLRFTLDAGSLHQGFLTVGANDENQNHVVGVVENVVGNERSWFVARTLSGFTVIDSGTISNATLGDPIGLRLEVVDGETYPHVKAWINLNGAGWTSVYDDDDTGGAAMLGDLRDAIVVENAIIGDAGDLMHVGSLFCESA